MSRMIALLLLAIGAVATEVTPETCQQQAGCVADEASLVQKESFLKVVKAEAELAEADEFPTLPPPEEAYDAMHQGEEYYWSHGKSVVDNKGKDFEKTSYLIPKSHIDKSPTDGMMCYEAPHNYLKAMLYRMSGQDSFLANWYSKAEIKLGSCLDQGYNVTADDVHKGSGSGCWPGAKFYIKPWQVVQGRTRMHLFHQAMLDFTKKRSNLEGVEHADKVKDFMCIAGGEKGKAKHMTRAEQQAAEKRLENQAGVMEQKIGYDDAFAGAKDAMLKQEKAEWAATHASGYFAGPTID